MPLRASVDWLLELDFVRCDDGIAGMYGNVFFSSSVMCKLRYLEVGDAAMFGICFKIHSRKKRGGGAVLRRGRMKQVQQHVDDCC